jgi:hypothetical protein
MDVFYSRSCKTKSSNVRLYLIWLGKRSKLTLACAADVLAIAAIARPAAEGGRGQLRLTPSAIGRIILISKNGR